MIDYTAMDCVKFGDMLGALNEDKVDDDVLQVRLVLISAIYLFGSGSKLKILRTSSLTWFIY